MTRTRRLGAGFGLVLLLGATLYSSPAAAVALTCGSIITRNTTLTANVGPCSNGGLIVRANNVVLNLGGFAVKGLLNQTGDGVGIRISNQTGVTVRNGRVTDFDAGVALENGSGHTIKELLVRDNISAGNTDFGDGIAISSSSGNTIRDNSVIHNGPFDGIGLIGPSSNNLIVNNVVRKNNVESTADDGIRIEGPGAKNNTVRSNSVTESSLDGIAIFSDQSTGNLNTGNRIVENKVFGNGYGFLAARPGEGIRTFLRANDNDIIGNTVTDNAGSGILIASGSLDNEILGNTATGNARRAAASPRYDLHDFNVNCDNNRWRRNIYGTAFPVCVTS